MKHTNILISLSVMLCIAFVVFQINGQEFLSTICKSLIVPLFTVIYFLDVSKKSKYFTLFLVLYSISELSVFLEYTLFEEDQLVLDAYYVIGNLIYIAAYVFLLLEVFKTIDFKNILKNYLVHVIVLTGLNVYIIYVLINIVSPRFQFEMSSLIIVELLYNIAMLLLLTFSSISYFYNDSKKTLLMFFGSICIVFSEVIQIAYYYIADQDLLNIVHVLLFVMAFYFFYFQSRMVNKKVRFFA
ncbi:hypothetical protein ACW5R3_06055 [Bizionia sp. KMM 8389]